MSGPGFDPAGILRALEAHRVRYVLIGGLAVIAHGHLRATADIDILPNPEPANLAALAGALQALDARISGVDADLLGIELDAPTLAQGANFTLETALGALDVMQAVPGARPYEQLDADAVSTELDGVPVRVVSLADLLALKRAADRPRDREDVAVLTEIASLDDQ